VAADQPDNPLPQLVLGSVLMSIAWRVRTGARHQDVSDEQFRSFFDYLRRSEECLSQATTLDPGLAPAWVLRLRAARGLQLPLEETWHRCRQLAAAQPHPYSGQQQVLQTLCPKWSGSFEQVDAFADECMRAAPAGAPNVALVAEAQVERLLELEGDARQEYFRNRDARGALWEAAQRSIFSPQWRKVPGWVMAANLFALAFYQTGFLPEVRRCFEVIGPYGVVTFWGYRGAGDSARAFVAARERAFADTTPVDPRRTEILDQYFAQGKPGGAAKTKRRRA
jgi:hypothetical protein